HVLSLRGVARRARQPVGRRVLERRAGDRSGDRAVAVRGRLQHLVAVDGAGDGLAHGLVGEWSLATVEHQRVVGQRRLLDQLEAALPGALLGDRRVAEDAQLEGAGLHAAEDRRLVGDDPELHRGDLRRAAVVPLVGVEHHLLALVPFAPRERTGAVWLFADRAGGDVLG